MSRSENLPTIESESKIDQARLSERLRRQARRLRTGTPLTEPPSLREPAWKRISCWVLLSLMVALALLLLRADDTRLLVADFLAQGWQRIWTGQLEQEVIELPPPSRDPTSRPPVRISVDSPSSASPSARSQAGSGSRRSGGGSAPTSIAKSAGSESAYRLLQQKSDVVRSLVAGESADYEFKSWSPVKDNEPEFWIDLVVIRKSDGAQQHLVWRIDVDEARVQALSQAARDLERKR